MNTSSTNTVQLSSNSSLNNAYSSSCTAGLKQLVNERYKAKCEAIHKNIKEMIFVNSALQMESRECKNQLNKMKIERKYLLNKLLEYEKGLHGDTNCGILQRVLSNSTTTTPE